MPRALPTPYAELTRGRTRLRFFHGDAVQILDSLDAGSLDAIVTSPPYNLGIRYRSYDDGRPRSEYLDWTGEWVALAKRALSDEGSLFLNVGAKPKDPWTALDVAQAVRPHLELQNIIHWVKSIAIEKSLAGVRSGLADDLAVGHYKPINSNRFLNDCHEFVFHFSKGGDTPLDRQAVGVKYQDKSNVTRWGKAGSGLRCRGNTWFLPYETIQSRDKERPHPATFPWRLPAYCLRLHGLKRLRMAADPFLGLGSSAVACATLGVSFVGVELDEHYLKEAIARTRKTLDAGQ
ncbi:MAG TPA: site-specific DNA-methyltransferase [Vicinamibacterales bacterium]|nr:site-specific DNA-methyltransferase [Vicinamibacterales bacterium]